MTPDTTPKKLGVLISSAPSQPNFAHGLRLVETAASRGIIVYLYLIDEAVPAIEDPRVQKLKNQGLHLFACAFGAKKRNLVTDDRATWVGLATASDLIASTDRFISFN